MISPRGAEAISSAQRPFVAGEFRHLIEGLILDPSILWVNPIDAVPIAERKVFQLRLAQELGLMIPPTIVTNDPDLLRGFASTYHDGVICKPIYQGLVSQGGERYAVYTSPVESGELCDDEQLRACPTLLQKRVPKGTDIRVTFIGKEMFSVEIDSPDTKPLDWRRPGEPLRYRSVNIPSGVEDRFRQLLRCLRLSYGAFDFVRSPDGELFFLEVNPTGEWAWLEQTLGLPMRKAFVKLFYH